MARDIKKTLRFSEDEFSKIESNLNGKTFSDFTRDILLNGEIKISRMKKADPQLLFEINKIGNNLNQIARKVNQKEKVSVLVELVEIEKNLKALL